jgi:hypothetical protein
MSITKAVESPAPSVAKNDELKMQAEVFPFAFPFAKYFSNKNSHSSSRELRREEIGNETINWTS